MRAAMDAYGSARTDREAWLAHRTLQHHADHRYHTKAAARGWPDNLLRALAVQQRIAAGDFKWLFRRIEDDLDRKLAGLVAPVDMPPWGGANLYRE